MTPDVRPGVVTFRGFLKSPLQNGVGPQGPQRWGILGFFDWVLKAFGLTDQCASLKSLRLLGTSGALCEDFGIIL